MSFPDKNSELFFVRAKLKDFAWALLLKSGNLAPPLFSCLVTVLAVGVSIYGISDSYLRKSFEWLAKSGTPGWLDGFSFSYLWTWIFLIIVGCVSWHGFNAPFLTEKRGKYFSLTEKILKDINHVQYLVSISKLDECDENWWGQIVEYLGHVAMANLNADFFVFSSNHEGGRYKVFRQIGWGSPNRSEIDTQAESFHKEKRHTLSSNDAPGKSMHGAAVFHPTSGIPNGTVWISKKSNPDLDLVAERTMKMIGNVITSATLKNLYFQKTKLQEEEHQGTTEPEAPPPSEGLIEKALGYVLSGARKFIG